MKQNSYENITTPIELLDYMSNNIKYGFLDKNGKIHNNSNSEDWNDFGSLCIVQDASGLLKTKHGTCWDQVELERDWFNNNYEYKTIFLWFELDKPNNLPTHTFLIFKDNDKYYWFENSFEKHRGIHEFNSEEDLIECVKIKQLEYAIENYDAKKEYYDFIKCYEYSKPNKDISVSDYLYHVTCGKYIK